MKIINLGILAHVDAGKTTLTESLLYTSGAIAELGSVDEGTTRTDTMNLERQRGITIQTAVTSFQWEDVKVNIIDTPGHMDFLAEVYRSLSVLDGAVLLVSAKDGIQAQTRILFHALQIMKIPTIFFINKIDQEGIDLPMVYQEMKAKLSSEIIVKQKVGQHPHINVTDNDDMEQWDAVIMGNDELLEKYMSGKPFKMSELEQEENRRFQNGTLFPVYHGSAKNNLGIRQLIEVIASKFYSSTPEGQSELCGQVFKIEYSEKRRRFVYVRIYSGTLHLRDVIRISEKEKIKITEMCVPTNGEIIPSALFSNKRKKLISIAQLRKLHRAKPRDFIELHILIIKPHIIIIRQLWNLSGHNCRNRNGVAVLEYTDPLIALKHIIPVHVLKCLDWISDSLIHLCI